MRDEVCRRRLPGLPRRGTPVPGPGRGVHRGTLRPFFRLFNPPFRDHPKMVYVKVLQKQAKPDLKTEKVSDGTVRAGVRSLVTVVTGTLGGASQDHARQKSSPS